MNQDLTQTLSPMKACDVAGCIEKALDCEDQILGLAGRVSLM